MGRSARSAFVWFLGHHAHSSPRYGDGRPASSQHDTNPVPFSDVCSVKGRPTIIGVSPASRPSGITPPTAPREIVRAGH
jgi:hypothetical protein